MKSAGFTIIEALVCIIVGAIFIIAIGSLLSNVRTSSNKSSQAFIADSLAYANLRKFANGKPPTWFTCPSTETDPYTAFSNTSGVNGLSSPVSQTVLAYAPYGCSTSDTNTTPLRVISIVQYGSTNQKAVHATYTAYQ